MACALVSLYFLMYDLSLRYYIYINFIFKNDANILSCVNVEMVIRIILQDKKLVFLRVVICNEYKLYIR